MEKCKELDSTLDVLLKFIHLPPLKMAGAIADINKSLEGLEQVTNEETIDKKIPAEVKAKKYERPTGDTCPKCGSIEYYQSGTCKTCRACAYAGGCG